MVFGYTVKVNGVKYFPGMDVPIDENGNEINEPKPTEEKPETNTLEQAKEALEQKADETSKKSRGRKPKQ